MSVVAWATPDAGYGVVMATGLARTRAPRPLLWALVVGVVLGVLALHHLAAHHGAADLDHDHHAGYAHDAEPAASGDGDMTVVGSDDAALSMGSSTSDPTMSSPAPVDADDDAGGRTGVALAVLPTAPSPGPLGDVAALGLAILGSLGLALALAMLRGPGAAARPEEDVGCPGGSSLATCVPPPSVPGRLAQLQVLRL
jgi:hypothetical protein